jgi:hypothetical protein
MEWDIYQGMGSQKCMQQILVETLKRRVHLGDLDVDERTP